MSLQFKLAIRGLVARLTSHPIVRIGKDEKGVAIVEFALIFPLLLLALLGSVDVTRAMMADRKLSAMASSVGDLVAREEAMQSGTMDQIFDAVAPLMTPYNADLADIRVTSLRVEENGGEKRARVEWSRARNMAGLADDAIVDVPEALLQNTLGLVYVEGAYEYQPLFGLVLSSSIQFSEDLYFVPRVSAVIEME
ncbi:MAG: TadE/TadG family type IV pilus assembly protein [Pseudomonadota bacterium]